MAITTDFIGHIGIEPGLSDEQIGHVAALRAVGQDDGRPPYASGWVASEDGRFLSLDGDDKFGDPAGWLRHIIRCFIKPGGLRADGVVVGCRRDNKELRCIQVSANRVSERDLWPRSLTPREGRRQPAPRRPTANVIDLATRRARA